MKINTKCLVIRQLKSDAPVGGGYVVEQLLVVLADEGLLVVAGNVVPRDAVIVHVVQDGQAGLVRAVDVELRVVGLPELLVASLAPRVESESSGDLV